ncbi:unnamed protein product [Haemonchus placei]|uniref:NADH dehydrogenase [ubiquinone] 1 alpha subcomplex subunit 12 n=1 Tax=Haemonchus placei TaxID=6290 RepID=A0A0N4WMS4_HAEPC|nr:unnamed protein product [Haemonchus placei]
MGVMELLGVDKLIKFGRIIKQIGGVRAALKKRYLMDVTRAGTLVGEDKFGNKYYEDNSYFVPRNRWVEFPEKVIIGSGFGADFYVRRQALMLQVWLDYDASQVPPEWHRWLHHITDDTPTQKPPQNEKWVMQHEENLSIFEDKKYIPYSTTRTKIQAWQPGQKKQQ